MAEQNYRLHDLSEKGNGRAFIIEAVRARDTEHECTIGVARIFAAGRGAAVRWDVEVKTDLGWEKAAEGLPTKEIAAARGVFAFSEWLRKTAGFIYPAVEEAESVLAQINSE